MFEFLTPTFIISVLLALSVHEWAHGYVAHKLGDATAKMEGRLTLNPLAHLDPVGTVLFVLVGFGWGKPVPVDPRYFKNIKRDTALVALAGPVSNFILALFAFVMLLFVSRQSIVSMSGAMMAHGDTSVAMRLLTELMTDFLHINLVLMAFNLLPIAPLDGSKIIRPFVPLRHENRYQDFMEQGPKILLILIVLGQLLNVPILSMWIGFIISPVLQLFSVLATLV
ncbi:site-2 protease family protein [Candidatus Peregrinibacteria bacterium CG10_big_fil_rev_8_21_14_0_10_49_24]|nr:MAG: site-2 protease family protein [Candidatus Peregrinibacteria bacterium CG11_big_fil_rev_8_21_14_0_20_49_14]PIR50795.1 MAG: site-2 protease family protein [Candidatus Peregrinibacteria bacterium CG10_big_fil_rev_8_21_14_0_10_49_24]PJA67799.1 MAG: site-2 protease family protein [Candidatus Peregrinibacteria bacterium CG_4_9_14_3_um_filter_49_12]